MREEFEVITLLGLFTLSNALTALLLRTVGITVDFWFALFLSLFAVGGNAGFLFLASNCVEEGNALLPCALVLFIVPGLILPFALPMWLPPIRLEDIPWDLIAKASITAASVALAAVAVVRRSPQLAAYAAMLASVLISAIVILS